MLKKLLFALAFFPLIAFAESGTISQLSPWIISGSYVKTASTTVGLQIQSLTNCNTIDTDGTGHLLCGTDEGGAGSGSPFPFTSTTYGVSTSTILGLLNGIVVNASSTFTGTTNFAVPIIVKGSGTSTFAHAASSTMFLADDGSNTTDGGFGFTSEPAIKIHRQASGVMDLNVPVSLRVDINNNSQIYAFESTRLIPAPNALNKLGDFGYAWNGVFASSTSYLSALNLPLSSTGLAVNSSGLVYGAATTTFSTGLTYLNGGVTCDVASGSIPGCLSAANWTTFNAKESALTFSYPLIRSVNTISFPATSTLYSNLSAGALGVNTAGSVYTSATTTITPTAPITSTYANGTWTTGCATCLTANQSITLTGAVTGTGATSITTAFGTMATGVLGNPSSSATIPTPQATSTLYAGLAGGTSGMLGLSQTGSIFRAATTTYTGTAPIALTYLNGVITGSCTTAASGVAGCLSSTAFDTFNNKEPALGTINGLVGSNGTIRYQVSTSTLNIGGTAASLSAILVNTLGGTGQNSSAWSGGVGVNGGIWYQAATTTYSTGLTYTNGAVTCNTSTSAVLGCLSAANWTTFNNKVATGTAIVTGQVPYWLSGGTLGSIATGTVTCSGSVSCGTTSYVLGTNLTITGTGGGGGLGWASSTPNTNSMYSYALGYVGIGTTTPYGLLHLATSTAPLLTFTNSTSALNKKNWGIFMNDTSGSIYFSTTTDATNATTSQPAFSLLSTGGMQVSGKATSTFGSGYGIDVTNGGCYAIAGTCIGSGGTLTGAGTNTYVPFWTSANNLSGDAAFAWDNTLKRLTVSGLVFTNATGTSIYASASSTIQVLNADSLALKTALSVASGGTGAITLTGCLTGNGTGVITGSGTCATFAYPWTTQSTWMATTSLLSISGGVMSTASSTLQNLFSTFFTMGTTTSFADLSVQRTVVNNQLPIFSIASSTNANGSATTTLFAVLPSGSIVIGTTTPSFLQSTFAAKMTLDTGTYAGEEAFNILSNTNDFSEINIKNSNSGSSAQACQTATSNQGSNTTGFISNCTNSSAFWNPQTYNVGGPGDTSIMGLSTNDMFMVNGTTGKSLYLMSGGVATSTNIGATIRPLLSMFSFLQSGQVTQLLTGTPTTSQRFMADQNILMGRENSDTLMVNCNELSSTLSSVLTADNTNSGSPCVGGAFFDEVTDGAMSLVGPGQATSTDMAGAANAGCNDGGPWFSLQAQEQATQAAGNGAWLRGGVTAEQRVAAVPVMTGAGGLMTASGTPMMEVTVCTPSVLATASSSIGYAFGFGDQALNSNAFTSSAAGVSANNVANGSYIVSTSTANWQLVDANGGAGTSDRINQTEISTSTVRNTPTTFRIAKTSTSTYAWYYNYGITPPAWVMIASSANNQTSRNFSWFIGLMNYRDSKLTKPILLFRDLKVWYTPTYRF